MMVMRGINQSSGTPDLADIGTFHKTLRSPQPQLASNSSNERNSRLFPQHKHHRKFIIGEIDTTDLTKEMASWVCTTTLDTIIPPAL
jgi:hypothetical protein